LLDIEAL
jgi:hypothetical protein